MKRTAYLCNRLKNNDRIRDASLTALFVSVRFIVN
nr:MAG TPA: hypothetical protein [Caudoviricetes sp.]